jgi:flagellar motility protein MotE (MotC chaperone)
MKALIFLSVGLLFMIAVLYGSLVYLKGEKEKLLTELATNDSTLTVEKPLSESDSLRNVVEVKEIQLSNKETLFDSLKNDAKIKIEKAKIKASEVASENMEKEKNEKALSMAKTFEKMSIKQIAPILKNLDDGTVMIIYNNTGNRFKKNILLAVTEKRAALITKEFLNNN